MANVAFIGLQGRGKSYFVLLSAIHYAMKFNRRIVLNFLIDIDALKDYAVTNGYRNLWLLIANGDIIYVPENVEYLMAIPNAIVVIDEAVLFFGDSAAGVKESIHLTSFINQTRRRKCDYFFIVHDLDRLHKFARDLIDIVIYCDSILKKDPLSGNPILIQFRAKFYNSCEEFDRWFRSPKRGGWIFDWKARYNERKSGLFFSCRDAIIFNIFDSYSEILSDAKRIGTGWQEISFELCPQEMVKQDKKNCYEIKNDLAKIKLKGSNLIKINLGEKETSKPFYWEYNQAMNRFKNLNPLTKKWQAKKKPKKIILSLIYLLKNLIKDESNDYIKSYIKWGKMEKKRNEWEITSPFEMTPFWRGRCKGNIEDINFKIFRSYSTQKYPPQTLTFGYIAWSFLSKFLPSHIFCDWMEKIKNSFFIKIPFSSKSVFILKEKDFKPL